LLTVHRQSDRGIGQPQLVLLVHLQARRDAATALQLVLEGRSRGNILNGTHDSLAALTDTLREVVGVVLATNARPARPRQRTPLSRRAGQWPRRRSGEGAGSRLHVGDRLGSLDAPSEVVSERATPGVGVTSHAAQSLVGETLAGRPTINGVDPTDEPVRHRLTLGHGVHAGQAALHLSSQALAGRGPRDGAEAAHERRAERAARRLHRNRGEAASGRLRDPATGAGQVHGAEAPANLLLHVSRRLRDTLVDTLTESSDALAGGLLDPAADLAAGGAGELLLPPLLGIVAPLVPQLPHEGEVSDLGPVLHSAREVAGHEVGQALGEVGELLHPHPQAVTQDDEEGLAHPVE